MTVKKRALIVFATLIGLVILDFVLEYPALLNQEIFFSKSLETKYSYASLDFQESLSQADIVQIYLAIVGDQDSCYVSDRFYNDAGLRPYQNSTEYLMETFLKKDISAHWKDKGYKTRFTSKQDTVTVKGRVINEFTLIFLGPIKRIDGNILVGYEEYSHPLSSAGWLYKVTKKNGIWVAKAFTIPWVS